jgi:hypothetical protein
MLRVSLRPCLARNADATEVSLWLRSARTEEIKLTLDLDGMVVEWEEISVTD